MHANSSSLLHSTRADERGAHSLSVESAQEGAPSRKEAAGGTVAPPALVPRVTREQLTPPSTFVGAGGIGADPLVSAKAAAAAIAEVAPEPAPRKLVDVRGLDEGHAARAWVLAVLGLDAQYASESEIPLLQDLLHSGVSLCRVMNAVRPGTIGRVKESDKPWDHMENIGNYTKACEKLHIQPTFETPDLFDCKNLRPVAQNVLALARAARNIEAYTGPLLAATHERMML